jgi:arabinogalactan endo-1,4-beta-galactosidase
MKLRGLRRIAALTAVLLTAATQINTGAALILSEKTDTNLNQSDSEAAITSSALSGNLKNNDTEAEASAVDAGIYVEQNTEIDDDFMMGMDISSYLSELNSGVIYYDDDGNEIKETAFFEYLADCGLNWVRIRVWNDPFDSNGNGYGGGNNDIEAAVTMGQWATEAGLRVFIDFHYSDFWADPSKQTAPKAWEDYTLEEKADAVYKFTTSSLETLIDAGVDVGMVQIGNETTGGICGVTVDDSASDTQSKWADVCTIFKAGSKAVREVDPDILIALHFTDPETSGRYIEIASALNKNEVDYDVFASSYYPYWHGDLSNLTNLLKQIASLYGKKVIVAETSYAYTYENGDGHVNTISADSSGIDLNYSVSVQGQAQEISDVIKAVTSVGEEGIGVFYWEGAWIPVNAYTEDDPDGESIWKLNSQAWEAYGSGWASSYAGEYDPDDAGIWYGGCAVDNQALFDFYGNPLESLKTFKYVKTGTTVDPEALVSAVDTSAEAITGEEIVLPETVSVYQANGKTSTCNVTWNQDEIDAAKAAGAGSYKITGTVEGTDLTVNCSLVIDGINLLTNAGFEDGNGAWTIDGTAVAIKSDASNVRSGRSCLKFYDDSDFEFTVTQTITLEAGTYELKAYVEGGDCGDDAVMQLFVKGEGLDESDYATLAGWQVWQQPKLTFTLEEETEVSIGVYVKAIAGGWGAWDDFHLSAVGTTESEASDTSIDSDGEKLSSADTTNSTNSSDTTSETTGIADNAILILIIVLAVGVVIVSIVFIATGGSKKE